MIGNMGIIKGICSSRVVLSTQEDLNTILVKKFNVFIRYFNGKTGDYDKDMDLCERIIKVYEKERFEQLKRDDSRSQGKSPFNKLIEKDVKDCEGTIISVCEGRFPK